MIRSGWTTTTKLFAARRKIRLRSTAVCFTAVARRCFTSFVADRLVPLEPSNAAILIDAGANISARDAEYRSTPLAWAARTNAVQMVELLLTPGAPTNLPDDEPWATPLAWAERRQHAEIASILRRQGAER
jgi:hypothetical protein